MHQLSIIQVGQSVIGRCSCQKWETRRAYRIEERMWTALELVRADHASHASAVGAPVPGPAAAEAPGELGQVGDELARSPAPSPAVEEPAPSSAGPIRRAAQRTPRSNRR